MEKEFIPYAEALALKELGFNEPCFGIWMERGDRHDVIYVAKQEDAWMAKQNDGILAPLYQQAFRWFREKHSIFPNVSYEGKFMNTFEILNIKGDDYNSGERFSYYDTYEEAELACLVTLIKIVSRI